MGRGRLSARSLSSSRKRAQGEGYPWFVAWHRQDRLVLVHLRSRGDHILGYVTTAGLVDVLRALAGPIQAVSRQGQ